MCRKADSEMITGMFDEIKEEYKQFMKDSIGKVPEIELELFPKNKFLTEEDIGGVILYCHGFRIVYNNTLKERINLCFKDSIPDIRSCLFSSLD